MGNYHWKQSNEKKNKYKEERKINLMKEETKQLNEIKEKSQNLFNYVYHCKECGEIPILYFSHFHFNVYCLNHKTLNIPIEEFYDFIIFSYECFMCKKSYQPNNIFYCYECNYYYCNNCNNRHLKEHNENHTCHVVNSDEKKIKCIYHHKNFIKFCLKCKMNLCELCDNHDNHYIEEFNSIYPLDDDIQNFYKIISNNLSIFDKKEEQYVDDYEYLGMYYLNRMNKKRKKNIINNLLVKSFNKNISNYNYIWNIKNILNNILEENPGAFDSEEINKEGIKYVNLVNSKDNKNNIENKILFKSMITEKNNVCSYYYIYCIKKLNNININNQLNLELIAIGGTNKNILLINCLNFKIYQIIENHEDTVYSLDQYKKDPNYLYSSSSDSTINIYKLDNNYKYRLIQKLRKAREKDGGEINKVIILSNKLLVSSDDMSITIWKSNNEKNKDINEEIINYEELYEIIINLPTFNLLEINPTIFVATQYNCFQLYSNNKNSFPLIGQLNKIKYHKYLGDSSNDLSKINDNIVCLGSNNCFYIISIIPLQILQKIIICSSTVYFLYITKENYIYCKGNQCILQYEIYNDENNNYIEIKEIGKFLNDYENLAILPLDDERVLYIEKQEYKIYLKLIA